MRVHELARSLGCQSKTVMAVGRRVGVRVRCASSKIEPTCAALLMEYVLDSPEWGQDQWLLGNSRRKNEKGHWV